MLLHRRETMAVNSTQCLRFEQENNLTKPSTSRGRHRGQLSSQDDQGELLPAGNAWRAWLFALENAELLAEEQDFDILVMVSLSAQSDEVEEDREDVYHKEKVMRIGVAGIVPSSENKPCAER